MKCVARAWVASTHDLLRIAVIARTTNLRFPMEELVKTHEVRGTRLGRLAVLKGEGKVRVGLRQVALILANWHSSARTPLTLIPLPFCKGRGDKTHACGYLWRPLPREVA